MVMRPHLQCIYSWQLRLYPVADSDRWVDGQAWRNGGRP
jgi:hypothetical protein